MHLRAASNRPGAPRFYGRRVLPELKQDEVEIARITIASTTQDVTESESAIRLSVRVSLGRYSRGMVSPSDWNAFYRATWECLAAMAEPLTADELVAIVELLTAPTAQSH